MCITYSHELSLTVDVVLCTYMHITYSHEMSLTVGVIQMLVS